jgi:hypothetical protein
VSNLLALIVFFAAFVGMLVSMKKTCQTGIISIFRRSWGATLHREKSPAVFWIVMFFQGLLALFFLGCLGFNLYLAYMGLKQAP